MSHTALPLSILDLSPIPAGGTVRQALGNTLDLAQRSEAAGYGRYWLAEHHFTPGVASAAPSVLIGQVAAATRQIRVGSAAVQTGHQTPIAIVEQFGTLDALFPGRIDLGLGRSGQRREEAIAELAAGGNGAEAPAAQGGMGDGVLIPKPFSFAPLLASSRLRSLYGRLQQPGAVSPGYTEQVGEILGLIGGTLRVDDDVAYTATPGTGADLEVWVFGSSRGESAQVAGERGLPFGANYHVSPATVLEAIDAYREAFRPSTRLDRPYVSVSADVVVADDDDTARRLASPYGLWVRSIRTGQGAIPFPTPEDAALHNWSAAERDLVADRVDTQFVGTPASVVEQLEVLARVTGADELVITTITHDHADRVRSFELLAAEWFAQRPAPAGAVVR